MAKFKSPKGQVPKRSSSNVKVKFQGHGQVPKSWSWPSSKVKVMFQSHGQVPNMKVKLQVPNVKVKFQSEGQGPKSWSWSSSNSKVQVKVQVKSSSIVQTLFDLIRY